MATPTASARSIFALGLLLGGPIVCLLGLLIVSVGLYELASGYGFGQTGAAAIMYGIPGTLLGFLAARKGRRMYRAIEANDNLDGGT